MTAKTNETLRADLSVSLIDLLAAAGSAFVDVYDGTQPADPNAAITDTVLVSFEIVDGWTDNDPGELLLVTTPVTATATASGTAGWVNLRTTDGYRIQGSIGVATGDFRINLIDIVEDDDYDLTAATINIPE